MTFCTISTWSRRSVRGMADVDAGRVISHETRRCGFAPQMAARVRDVVWAESARDALEDVTAYIAQDSLPADGSGSRGGAPSRGEPVDASGERGRVVPELNDRLHPRDIRVPVPAHVSGRGCAGGCRRVLARGARLRQTAAAAKPLSAAPLSRGSDRRGSRRLMAGDEWEADLSRPAVLEPTTDAVVVGCRHGYAARMVCH